jgi:phosphoenolpyruvate---glycerone phosphotransferase subunit DhaL
MRSISSANIETWLRRCAEVFTEHMDELTDLDAKIGDADHGVNMARGFSAIPLKLDSLVDRSIGSLFRASAMTLISKVGGASGPLYGTFFLQAARACNGKTELTLKELCQCFDNGLAGIVKLGKAVLGDKTMVDALAPALEALHPKNGDSLNAALQRVASVAHAAAANVSSAGTNLKIVTDELSSNLIHEQRLVASQAPEAVPCLLLKLSSEMAAQSLDMRFMTSGRAKRVG